VSDIFLNGLNETQVRWIPMKINYRPSINAAIFMLQGCGISWHHLPKIGDTSSDIQMASSGSAMK
jgi:hypothetical protein